MKRKRLFMYILLVGLFLMIGCQKSTPQLETIVISQQAIGEFSGDVPAYNITLPSYGHVRDEEYFAEWETYINDRFNIDLSINFTMNNESNYLYDYSLEYLSKKQTGLFFVEAEKYGEFINYAIDYNMIVDVSDYLEDNKVWNELPDAFKEIYINGSDVFGIPNTITPKIYGRMINQEWLKNTKLEQPESMAELANLFYTFTYNDPNESGVDDTIGMEYTDAYDFIDIFNAYGSYLELETTSSSHSRYVTSITYNPIMNKYEDCMFNDSMEDTLNYIQNLVAYDTCVYENDSITGGTYFGLYSGNDSQYILNSKMIGERSNKVIALSYIDEKIGAYFLGANTDNAEGVLNSFIDTFYGSEEGNKIGEQGIYSDQADILIPYVVENLFENTNNDVFALLNDLHNAYYIYPENYVNLSTNKLFKNSSWRRNSLSNSFYSQFTNGFNSFLLNEMSSADFISSYMTNAKKLGLDELLEQLNDKSHVKY